MYVCITLKRKNMFIKIYILFFCFTDLLLCEETTTSLDNNVENTDTTILVDTEIPEITENTTDKDTENVTKSNTNPESTKETTVLPTTTIDPILEICNLQNAVRAKISSIYFYLKIFHFTIFFRIIVLLCRKSMLLSPG